MIIWLQAVGRNTVTGGCFCWCSYDFPFLRLLCSTRWEMKWKSSVFIFPKMPFRWFSFILLLACTLGVNKNRTTTINLNHVDWRRITVWCVLLASSQSWCWWSTLSKWRGTICPQVKNASHIFLCIWRLSAHCDCSTSTIRTDVWRSWTFTCKKIDGVYWFYEE